MQHRIPYAYIQRPRRDLCSGCHQRQKTVGAVQGSQSFVWGKGGKMRHAPSATGAVCAARRWANSPVGQGSACLPTKTRFPIFFIAHSNKILHACATERGHQCMHCSTLNWTVTATGFLDRDDAGFPQRRTHQRMVPW